MANRNPAKFTPLIHTKIVAYKCSPQAAGQIADTSFEFAMHAMKKISVDDLRIGAVPSQTTVRIVEICAAACAHEGGCVVFAVSRSCGQALVPGVRGDNGDKVLPIRKAASCRTTSLSASMSTHDQPASSGVKCLAGCVVASAGAAALAPGA